MVKGFDMFYDYFSEFTDQYVLIGGVAVWHGILQFVFLADVLDAMYLATKKWKKGKKSPALRMNSKAGLFCSGDEPKPGFA